MRRLFKLLTYFGFNIKALFSLIYLPKYILDYLKFRRMNGSVASFFPILIDYFDSAGVASGHYFHQDLLVATDVFINNPIKHLDVGSRIDGFVAHVASFREIFVLDIRPLDKCAHKNIQFIQADIMTDANLGNNLFDSVSCLHALEHFGLGRYGDPIFPDGHLRGLITIVNLTSLGGRLYLSVPFTTGPSRVEFNAHRVFNISDFLNFEIVKNQLNLLSLRLIDDNGALLDEYANIDNFDFQINYGCAVFIFERKK